MSFHTETFYENFTLRITFCRYKHLSNNGLVLKIKNFEFELYTRNLLKNLLKFSPSIFFNYFTF